MKRQVGGGRAGGGGGWSGDGDGDGGSGGGQREYGYGGGEDGRRWLEQWRVQMYIHVFLCVYIEREVLYGLPLIWFKILVSISIDIV